MRGCLFSDDFHMQGPRQTLTSFSFLETLATNYWDLSRFGSTKMPQNAFGEAPSNYRLLFGVCRELVRYQRMV